MMMDESLELLAQYQWIYNFKLTNFFRDRVWENIPPKWTGVLLSLSVDELNNLPFGKVKDEWPDCFKRFISKCLENSLPRDCTLTIDSERVIPLSPSDIGDDVRRGMSQKKLHEVCHMTAVIDHVTRTSRTRAVVDVGSGLGYLGQVLHRCYGHQILGLEGKQCHTTGAEKRSVQTVKCPGLQNVTCELHQNSASKQEFMSFVQDWLQSLPPGGSHYSHQTGSKKLFQCSQCDVNKTRNKSGSRKQDQSSATVSYEKNKNLTTSCKRKSSDRLNVFDSELNVDDETHDSSQGFEADIEGTSESNATEELVDDNPECMREVPASCGNHSGICDNRHSESRQGRMASERNRDMVEDCSNEDRGLREEIQEIESKVSGKLTVTGSTANEEVIGDNGVGVNMFDCDAKDFSNSDLHMDIQGTVNQSAYSGDENADVLGSGCEKTHMLGPESETAEVIGQVCENANELGPENETAKVIGPVCENANELGPDNETVDVIGRGFETGTVIGQQCDIKAVKQTETGCMCMVGLHCCGDLTPTMLRYYVELDCVRGLCCVSCCYHRMNFNETSNQFENFPMSRCVQESMSRMSDRYPGWFLNTYAMRLAAQETRARWKCQSAEDHGFHTRNVAYRGLLEVCLEQGKYVLKKTARKLAHRNDHSSYKTYVDKVTEHIAFPETDMEAKARFRGHMMDLYKSYEQYFQYIEAFTALQFLVQPVIESLIHQDRQQCLKEHGYHSNIVPMFDEALSPRNLALIAVKC